MKRPVRRSVQTIALGLLILAAAQKGTPAHAQEKMGAFEEGTHVFRRILFDAEMTPLKEFGDLKHDPRHKILIVLGDTRCLEQVPGGVENFVKQGGALFLATDQRIVSKSVREEIAAISDVTVTGSFVVCNDPPSRYRNLQHCPFLNPRAPGDGPDLFHNLQKRHTGIPPRVATNQPSYLSYTSRTNTPKLKELADLPSGSFTWPWDRLGMKPLFAVGGEVDNGRVLVLADHSIFINVMMMQSDNDNVEFTRNCVEWLKQDGTRTEVLFVEEGRIRDNFNIPLKEEPLPIPDVLRIANQGIDRLNAHLADVEEENAVNKPIWNALYEPKPTPQEAYKEMRGKVWRILGVVLTLALLFYGSFRLGMRGRHRLEMAAPLLPRAVQDHTPRGPVLEQRYAAMQRLGNLWESARELARQCFAPYARPSPEPPLVVARGGWWQRRKVARQVRRLWLLAFRDRPEHVSHRALRALLAELRVLKAALADGTVRLENMPAA
jgi:hypothetical protein